jgi:uncharacterized protein
VTTGPSTLRPSPRACVLALDTDDEENRMKCPKDTDVTLLMTSRDGIEIDYCPECRGVWLDRGELDKLIERADRDDDDDDRRRDRDDDRWRVEGSRGRDDDRYDERDPKYAKKNKRKSFFSEIFEMGGD